MVFQCSLTQTTGNTGQEAEQQLMGDTDAAGRLLGLDCSLRVRQQMSGEQLLLGGWCRHKDKDSWQGAQWPIYWCFRRGVFSTA
jgi:hypothetical protein